MILKKKEKLIAVNLRRQGLSYSEILKKISVSKSTLSLWLRSVGLSKKQTQRITAKRRAASLRGAAVRHAQRISTTKKIHQEAEADITSLSQRELWLMGTMLYWAEGSKEKEGSPGSGVEFINSDPHMIKLFLKWLFEVIKIKKDRLVFGIYIHENKKNNIQQVVNFWSEITRFPKECFSYVHFKKHRIKTNRKKINDSYYGSLRVRVRASSGLNRKIDGWVKGVNKYYWGVE